MLTKCRSDPHPIFVIVLVGPDEQPFGIQKDFLCAKSSFYRKYFAEAGDAESIEHIVRLPDTAVDVFAYAQNFLYTADVFTDAANMPSYEVLVGVWNLGAQLGVDGLCDRTLEAMAECRRLTQHIPATPLLVRVWRDTPEGSSIRRLLLSWAAEYMRSSESRAEFARSLPQEVLSELVVAMSSLDAASLAPAHAPASAAPRKNVHYLDPDEAESLSNGAKKSRHSDVLPNGALGAAAKPLSSKKPPRTSLPAKPPAKRRSAVSFAGDMSFTAEQKMNFCSDLLARMLSGPGACCSPLPVPLCHSLSSRQGRCTKSLTSRIGFWTRLVGPFREPVDPLTDGVPDYLDKITAPMDLGTMKAKMDRHEYDSDEEFLKDMRQIFINCYTYWNKNDLMWASCEKLEKTFEEKYAQMNKWIAKMQGDENA